MRYSINMDSGGTFTDGFFTRDVEIKKVKVDTTPHDFLVCFRSCIEEGAKAFEVTVPEMLQNTEEVRFSSTICSNIMITRSGPKVGLLVTKGSDDDLYGEDSGQDHLFDFILSPSLVIGIGEEIDTNGRQVKAPGEEEVRASVKQLLQDGAKVLVVSLKHANLNDINEKTCRQIINDAYPSHFLGAVSVLLSTEVSNSPSDRLRTNTAVVDAYLHKAMAKFLYKADEYLRNSGYQKPLLVVHSGGGTARVAKTVAIQTWGAGPAGGLAGSSFISQQYSIKDLVSIDIGGTSTDIGVVADGKYSFNYEPEIENIKVSLPIIDLESIGGGGGSIVRTDQDKKTVQVGPDSAEALPGPVCYDLGGSELTVTDACLVLGYFTPEYFLGGRKKLNYQKAWEVIRDKVATPLAIEVEQAAHLIVQKLESDVANEINVIFSRAGIKPGDCILLSVGGGGGTFSANIARKASISKAYCPDLCSIFCAFGLSTMDVVHRYESARTIKLFPGLSQDSPAVDDFNMLVRSLSRMAARDMRGEGFGLDRVEFSLELEACNLSGSGFSRSSGLLLGPVKDVKDLYGMLIKRLSLDKDQSAAVKNFQLYASVPISHYQFAPQQPTGKDPAKAYKGQRKVYWGGSYINTNLYERNRLSIGNEVTGPAIIESEDTTIVVPAGHKYTVDEFLNGILEEA
jgi:N-methylhydantoinase A